jgi:nitric oxide dioxygenase
VEKMAGIASLAFYQELFTLGPSARRLFRGNIEEQGQKLIAALRLIVDTLETPQAIMPMP